MKTLLWIDDDEKLIDASIPVFLKNGFAVLKTTNITNALSVLRTEEPDGVLLDVRLRGEENGLEILPEIRRLYPTLKVAIFTGYPEYDDHVQAEELGASAYLTKIKKSFPLDTDKQRRFFQALDRIFPSKKSQIASTPSPSTTKQKNDTLALWGNGLFYILLFAIIITGIGVLSNNVSPWALPIVLIAGILLFSIIGAFVLRSQGNSGLSQKNFLKLILEAFKLVPLLRKSDSNPNETDETEKEP